MFLNRHFKVTGIFTTVALLSLAMTPAISMPREVPTSEEVLAEQSPSDPMEEIIVYGDKTLHHYRLEMYTAQDIVFDTFNSINSDDEFDVHCYEAARTGTRIRRHICQANYVKEAEAAEALAWQLGQAEVPAKTVIIQKRKELMEELDRLVTENPELREAVIKYGDSIQVLEAARHEKCDGRIIACRK